VLAPKPIQLPKAVDWNTPSGFISHFPSGLHYCGRSPFQQADNWLTSAVVICFKRNHTEPARGALVQTHRSKSNLSLGRRLRLQMDALTELLSYPHLATGAVVEETR
jgi:hypothetical protein